jgi:lipopolysaccharide/colanic/teichoic acid biosynthesis glycosyltransferase
MMSEHAEWQWPYPSITSANGQDEYFYFLCKRCLDVLLTLSILSVLAPVMLLIAVLIKLDTPGPALFVQQRVGARRRVKDRKASWEIITFPCFKFRSMIHGADQSVHQAHIEAFVNGKIEMAGVDHSSFKLMNDPRVTRVGKFLRKTSLDELPQLLNVLRGEMSLVGPRPVPTYEVAQYGAQHWERLAVLPGITGLWQVKGRCQVSFEDMVRMDIEYARQHSLWLDLKIIILTIPAVLSGRGAG